MNNENKRAGEISPVLRWVKASERNPDKSDNKCLRVSGKTLMIGYRYTLPSYSDWRTSSGSIPDEQVEWLEEAPPTPAPEVKEEQPLETVLRFEYDGDSIDFNCPDEDGDIAVIVKNKGARHSMVYSLTLQEAEEVASFLSRHVNNENRSIPPEPVKDSPVEQKDPHSEWIEATIPPDKEGHYNVITEANCFIISAYEMGDWGYNRQTDEMVSMAGMGTPDRVVRYRPNSYQPFLDELEDPTEQPAHVPDPKGEIPEEIMQWIDTQINSKDEFDNAQSVGKELMIAMYHKMQEVIQMYVEVADSSLTTIDKVRAELAEMTSKRPTWIAIPSSSAGGTSTPSGGTWR